MDREIDRNACCVWKNYNGLFFFERILGKSDKKYWQKNVSNITLQYNYVMTLRNNDLTGKRC